MMGYSVYEDRGAIAAGVFRWAGYAISAICDMPDCENKIDRGLSYKCETYYVEDEETGEESEQEGCGLYFCAEHESYSPHAESIRPKPDVPEWEHWILTHESWELWRFEHPQRVAEMQARVAGLSNLCSEECDHA